MEMAHLRINNVRLKTLERVGVEDEAFLALMG